MKIKISVELGERQACGAWLSPYHRINATASHQGSLFFPSRLKQTKPLKKLNRPMETTDHEASRSSKLPRISG